VLPPDGIPDRGGFVEDLTLLPRPTRPIDVYQPITSPETMDYVPAMGFKAVYWLQHPERQQEKWEHYAARRAEAGNPCLRAGDDRVLVLNIHVAATHEEAVRNARPGHDEFCKFLAPYGRFSSYRKADGSKVPFDFQPTVEDSMAQQIWAIGSVEDVVETIGMYRDLLGLEHLCAFVDLPGLTRAQIDEQFALIAGEVMPRLGESLDRPRP
jgi:alkanesulfonate monooxygenase SsuD/methylene tetrahydromethanopterin reductase-like flavin-dependent oxidoreductase (luciferase family)